MSGKICPSMMCADIGKLMETLAVFEREGIEYLHIDVMDGLFVPNFQIGTDYIKQLRAKSPIPLDIHLMIQNPEQKLDWFDIQPGEYVSVHYESTPHPHRAVARIKALGAKSMIALNPGTPLYVIEDLLADLDAVLLMTVDPGFAGQSLIPQTVDKIARLKKYLREKGRPDIEIEVDGNVSLPNARKMADAGAGLFVAGTAGLFLPSIPLDAAIRQMREAIV